MTAAADPLAAANASRDILTMGIGPTLGYHVSQCPDGGFVVLVDGKIRSACSSLQEAMMAIGRFASDHFGSDGTLPRPDLTEADVARRFAQPRVVSPPQTQPRPAPDGGQALSDRARATAVLVLGLLAVGARGLLGV